MKDRSKVISQDVNLHFKGSSPAVVRMAYSEEGTEAERPVITVM